LTNSYPLPDSSERRHSPRMNALAYVRVKPLDTHRFYYIKDISEVGAFLLSSKSPQVGSVIRLAISLRLMKTDIEVKARVIRQEKGGFAIKFLQMSDESRRRLRKNLYGKPKEVILSKFQDKPR